MFGQDLAYKILTPAIIKGPVPIIELNLSWKNLPLEKTALCNMLNISSFSKMDQIFIYDNFGKCRPVIAPEPRINGGAGVHRNNPQSDILHCKTVAMWFLNLSVHLCF